MTRHDRDREAEHEARAGERGGGRREPDAATADRDREQREDDRGRDQPQRPVRDTNRADEEREPREKSGDSRAEKRDPDEEGHVLQRGALTARGEAGVGLHVGGLSLAGRRGDAPAARVTPRRATVGAQRPRGTATARA